MTAGTAQRIRTIKGFGIYFNALESRLRIHYARVDQHPVGVMITFQNNNKIYYGISKCNLKAGDKFDRTYGKAIALHRMLHSRNKEKQGKLYGFFEVGFDNEFKADCLIARFEALVGILNEQ